MRNTGRWAVAVMAAVLASACGAGTAVQEVAPTTAPTTSPGAGTGTISGSATRGTAPPVTFAGPVTVRFGDAAVRAEVAHTPTQRSRGLMFREELGSDDGMLFTYPSTTRGGFWMKNTLIPLSIAFMRQTAADPASYEVLAMLDMEPCEANPCPTFDPGVAYEAALEVNQGWFGDHGVEAGSTGVVEGTLPTPR